MALKENKFFPSVVYLPLTDLKAKLASTKVEVGDKVKVGTLVAEKYYGKEKTPIFSSVSGKVIAFENRVDIDGKEINHIAIENDGKYETESTLSALKKEETLQEKLTSLGIKDLDKNYIYTGLHYQDVKAIFVDAIYPNEIISKPNYEVLKERAEKVVSSTEKYAKEIEAPAYIVVSKNIPLDVYACLEEQVAKTTNVKLLKQKYEIGWQYKLIKKMTSVEMEIDKFKGVVLVSIATINHIAKAIENGLPVVKKGVTIYSSTEEPRYVEIPVGTPIEDLITTDRKVVITVGSLVNGKTIVSPKTVIGPSVYSLNVVEPLCLENEDCNRCGLCNDVCPVGILPSEVIFADNLQDEEKLNTLYLDKCIECGKCSFICPTRVNVLERVRRAKRRVQ